MARMASPAAPDWATGDNRLPERVTALLDGLKGAYPDAALRLRFTSPFELLCATVLAAQATDDRVNTVTPSLFARWPDPAALSLAPVDEVAAVVRPTGYYRQKAARLVDVSHGLVTRFGGEVPRTVDELTSLPGVGRKTAIVVLNHGYGIPAGVAVDTHVHRLAGRLDWSHARDPERVEAELRALVPAAEWIRLQDLFATHGRAHCRAPRPRCDGCPIEALCYSPDKATAA